MVAHAVYSQTAGFRGCIDDVASRAHAERIDAPSVRQIRRQLIGGRRKVRTAFRTVLCMIDHRLRVFHTDSHGECFCLHGDLAILQHQKSISCAMSDGKDRDLRIQNFFCILPCPYLKSR